MSSGRENVFSFGVITENFEVFENDNFARSCGWQVRVNGILSVFSFCEACTVVSRSISWGGVCLWLP